jgi:PAS domain S-box-containing protein
LNALYGYSPYVNKGQKETPVVKKKNLLLNSDLNRFSSSVLSSLNQHKSISQTLRDIRNIFKSSFCWIYLFVEDTHILTSSGSSLKHKGLIASKFLPKLSPRLLRKTHPLIYDGSSESKINKEILFRFLAEQNITKFMGVPLIQSNRLIGTLNLVRGNKSPSFTPGDLKQLALLGNLLSMTLPTPVREKLQHSQEFLEAIIDNLPNPVFIKDRKHRWVVINQALSDLTGYPTSKMLGKSDYDLFPKVQADFFWKKDREMFNTGRVIDIPEESITDKNGKVHYLHTKKAPLKNSTGEITHLVGIIEDITELKRTERALIKKEKIARERALLLNDLRTLYKKDQVLNRACKAIRDSRLFERAVMTLHDSSRRITHLGQVGLPHNIVELARKSPPLGSKQIQRIMNKRFRMSDSYFIPAEAGIDLSKSGRYIPQKKNSSPGEWRIGDELFVPLRDFSGIVMGYLSVDTPTDGCRPNMNNVQSLEMLVEAAASRIRELDAQKVIEESEEKYRLLVEHANEAIIVAQEGYLKFVNPKMSEILDYSEKELLTKLFAKFIHPEDRKMVLDRHLKRIMGKEVPPIYDFRAIDKKGNIKWLEINAVKVIWDNKPATLNFMTDITKRKQDEQLKSKYQEQKMLFELTQALSTAGDLDQLLKIATKKVTELIGIERSSIILVNPDGKSATFNTLYAQGGKANSKLLGYTFKSDTFLPLKRLIFKKPFMVDDTSLLPKGSFLKNFFKQLGIKSNLSVSLISRDKFLGSINIATKEKQHAFSTAEIRLLQMIANTIAVIIENYKFLEDLKSQSRQLDAQLQEQKMLFELTQALSYATDLNQLRKISIQMVAKIMHTERAAIGVITPKGDSFTVQEILVKGKHGDPYSLKFVKSTFAGVIKVMMFKHQPSIVNDTSIYPPGSLERKILTQRGIKSAMGVPLVSHGKAFGYVAISSMSKVHHYTPEEVQLLQTISNPIAMAIENRLLLENLNTQKINLEKQTQEKDILLKVSQALSQTTDIDRVANTASEVVGKTLDVDRCSIILLTEDGTHVEIKGIFTKYGTEAKKLIGKRYPIETEPNWRNIIAKRKVLVINDTAAANLDGVIKEHQHKEGLKSLLVTGMFFGNKLIGVLSLSSITKLRPFTKDEIKLAQTIANQIAAAIENARLMQVVKVHTHELKELSSQLMQAQEGERKRIAQELHDQVGQMLQTMKMNLDRMKRNLSLEPRKLEEARDWLMDTEKKLSQTIDDIRTLTFNLRPSMLDDFGLFSTLRWYIEDYSRRSNVKVFLKGKEDRYRFPLEIEVNLYRIVQEALTNVVKHANATDVTIFLSHKNSDAILSVKDNGRGFDNIKLSVSPHKGTGIYNMKERVNLLGGSFEIISQPGKGTRVNVKIPLTEVKYEEGQIIDR